MDICKRLIQDQSHSPESITEIDFNPLDVIIMIAVNTIPFFC